MKIVQVLYSSNKQKRGSGGSVNHKRNRLLKKRKPYWLQVGNQKIVRVDKRCRRILGLGDHKRCICLTLVWKCSDAYWQTLLQNIQILNKYISLNVSLEQRRMLQSGWSSLQSEIEGWSTGIRHGTCCYTVGKFGGPTSPAGYVGFWLPIHTIGWRTIAHGWSPWVLCKYLFLPDFVTQGRKECLSILMNLPHGNILASGTPLKVRRN